LRVVRPLLAGLSARADHTTMRTRLPVGRAISDAVIREGFQRG
jgi:hypothetical protein